MSAWIAGLGESISQALSNTLQNLMGDIWNQFASWLWGSLYDALAEFFGYLSGLGLDLFDLPWVQGYLHFFRLFGIGLCISGTVLAIMDIAVDWTTHGALHVRRQLFPLFYAGLACGLFTVLPIELYKTSVSLQIQFTQDLLHLTIGMNSDWPVLARQAMSVFSTHSMGSINPFLPILALLCLGYCTIKCFLGSLKRGGILLIQMAVGSLHLFNLPRGLGDGFFSFARQVIAICFTTFLQTLLLTMGLSTMLSHPLLGLGVLLSSTEVPRIAQQFGLDTSTKVQITQAVRTTSMALQLGRTLAHH